MRPPFPPLQLILLLFILVMAISIIYLGVFAFALEKLGLSTHSAMLLLISTMLGSGINLPLFQMQAEAPSTEVQQMFRNWYFGHRLPFTGNTIVAINVGGAVIPICFSIYLFQVNPLPLSKVILAISIVAVISFAGSRPIKGIGIGMPIFLAPLVAALTALSITPDQSAPMAYICGTLGVLIGADLLRMKDVRKIGTPVASIGGAGTFDGIFLTGIVAVLLA
ncbi:MAG: DUF1614 domain-containing protein [Gammaproteobacteria bacterium]|nr:DUF1614 domain-containing protein [Gammaproteobacteria bacterium]